MRLFGRASNRIYRLPIALVSLLNCVVKQRNST